MNPNAHFSGIRAVKYFFNAETQRSRRRFPLGKPSRTAVTAFSALSACSASMHLYV